MTRGTPDPTRAAREFAARLRATRDRQRLTQVQLAERAGLTPSAVSQIEAGLREPNFSTIVRLAKALSTTPNDLMGIGDEVSIDPSLAVLFRKVKKLSEADVQNVQAFIKYLESKDES